MTAKVGRAVVLTWASAQLNGVQQKDISCNGEPIDVTSDEDSGKRTLLSVSGQDEVNISLSGVDKASTIKTAWHSGNRTEAVTITYPNGDVLSGNFFMAGYSEGLPYNGAATFSCELQSTGAVTFTPAA